MKLRPFDIVALILSITIFLLFFLSGRRLIGEAGYLLIQEEAGESLYSLGTDRTITVEGPVGESVIEIEGGHAHFEHSDCADQLCVQMGDIENSGDWAACLPNKVFILIEGGQEEEIDEAAY